VMLPQKAAMESFNEDVSNLTDEASALQVPDRCNFAAWQQLSAALLDDDMSHACRCGCCQSCAAAHHRRDRAGPRSQTGQPESDLTDPRSWRCKCPSVDAAVGACEGEARVQPHRVSNPEAEGQPPDGRVPEAGGHSRRRVSHCIAYCTVSTGITHWSVQVQMRRAEQDGVRQPRCVRVQLTDVKAHCIEISFLSCRSN